MPGTFVQWFHDMSFDMPRLPNQLGTVLRGTLFSNAAALDTVFRERAQRAKEASYASFDAACRCHASDCRGASLRSRGERSGAIAFARSLQPVAGGYRHRMTVSEGSTRGEGAFAVTPQVHDMQVHDMTAHRQRLPL
jgi:hypothetical protein